MVKWLLLAIAALFGWGAPHVVTPKKDYVGVVAAEAAYASLVRETAPVKPNPPVDPKNCSTCGGTGKVKTGDGQGWTKCPTCQPMTTPEKPTMPMTNPPSPAVGFPARSSGVPTSKNCPDGKCPLQVYQKLHS